MKRNLESLDTSLDRYVRMRRAMGFKFRDQEKHLKKFVAFLQTRNASYITCKSALEWVMQCDGSSHYRAHLLSFIRGFARYLLKTDSRTEVPPVRLLRVGNGRARPHIYTQQEVSRLMGAAATLSPEGLRNCTYPCLFGLLAVTGMRVSEALHLKKNHADLKEGILTIHLTKSGKSRIIPLHSSTQRALAEYVIKRDSYFKEIHSPYFFVNSRGRQLKGNVVRLEFSRLSLDIGLRTSPHRGPRLHDFRHSFAVSTLLGWYRAGEDIEARLPALATFLGHENVTHTYWYLSATPELMQQVASRLHRRWNVHS